MTWTTSYVEDMHTTLCKSHSWKITLSMFLLPIIPNTLYLFFVNVLELECRHIQDTITILEKVATNYLYKN